MQHYLMMTTTYYLMVVAVAKIQLQPRPQQRLQKRDIVVVDVCEDGRDDSLDDDDDDGVDNLYKLYNDEEEQSELFGDCVHADLMTTPPVFTVNTHQDMEYSSVAAAFLLLMMFDMELSWRGIVLLLLLPLLLRLLRHCLTS